MGKYTGTGNVADNDEESLVFADKSEWIDEVIVIDEEHRRSAPLGCRCEECL